jgi:hypothetical protein
MFLHLTVLIHTPPHLTFLSLTHFSIPYLFSYYMCASWRVSPYLRLQVPRSYVPVLWPVQAHPRNLTRRDG